jgi:hypothetical protein
MIKHLKENNETYFGHLKFAWTAAFHMLVSSCCLLVHGLLPFIPTTRLFNIATMARKLKKWEIYSLVRKMEGKPK